MCVYYLFMCVFSSFEILQFFFFKYYFFAGGFLAYAYIFGFCFILLNLFSVLVFSGANGYH